VIPVQPVQPVRLARKVLLERKDNKAT